MHPGTHGVPELEDLLHGRSPGLAADLGKSSAPEHTPPRPPVTTQEGNCFLLGKTPRQQISAKVREGYCWHQRLLRPQLFLPQKQKEKAAKANWSHQAAPSPISHPYTLAVPTSAATFSREGTG
jgi:hypothetical protein